MSGPAPDASARLIRLAHHLSLKKLYPQAAFALHASATSSASTLAPSVRAAALVSAARLLIKAGGVSHATRARAFLCKAIFILDSCPGNLALRLQAGSLLESASEGNAALQAVRTCLELLSRKELDVDGGWSWWVYFKGREVVLYEPREGLLVAKAAASEAENRAEYVTAAGFHLMAAQIDLALVRNGAVGGHVSSPTSTASASLEAANALILKSTGRGADVDVVTLRVCEAVLRALFLLRGADVAEMQKQSIALKMAFDSARATTVGGSSGSQWKWQNGKVLRSLVHHILAAGLRYLNSADGAPGLADKALTWAGLRSEAQRNGQAAAFGGKLSPHAEASLAVVLLDSAARLKLRAVDMAGAAPLIRAALVRAQNPVPGLSLATQASAYLLAAEYFMLQGSHRGAERATLYLTRVIETANSSGPASVELGDIAHMCRTYSSLLTGEKRLPVNCGAAGGRIDHDDHDPTADGTFLNTHVRCAALFAEGVQEMRQANVLDAKRSLKLAQKLVCSRSDNENAQLLANVSITLASLYLSHPNVGENVDALATVALNFSSASPDLITRARTLRMRRKLVARTASLDENQLARVEVEQSENERKLRHSQDSAVRL